MVRWCGGVLFVRKVGWGVEGRKTFRMSLSVLKVAPNQVPDIMMVTTEIARNKARVLLGWVIFAIFFPIREGWDLDGED